MKKLPGNNEIVRRAYLVPDIRTEDEGSVVEGHAAVFDQTVSIAGWFNEVIERGAFDGTDFDDVLLFVNHDASKIALARSRRNNGNSTMQLGVDDKGLAIKASLDTERNATAAELMSALKRGDIDAMSFMFTVAEAKWTELDSDMPTRHITKVGKVYEVSAVNWPAYNETDISARGSLESDRRALDNARAALDNAKNDKEQLELARAKLQIM